MIALTKSFAKLCAKSERCARLGSKASRNTAKMVFRQPNLHGAKIAGPRSIPIRIRMDDRENIVALYAPSSFISEKSRRARSKPAASSISREWRRNPPRTATNARSRASIVARPSFPIIAANASKCFAVKPAVPHPAVARKRRAHAAGKSFGL